MGCNIHSFILKVSVPVDEFSRQNVNTHHMVTWSKARIFKPKVFAVEVVEREPRTIKEVFAYKEWRLET